MESSNVNEKTEKKNGSDPKRAQKDIMFDSHLHHPDVTIASSPWSEDQTLHVAAVYSNPFRWRTRRELANDFRRHMSNLPNVQLHMVELAYGDRPFEVTNPLIYPNDIQLRTRSELFHKENLTNIAVSRFPANWRYGAAIDADFHFTRHDIALETIHQLQMYDWVQPYSSFIDISGKDLGKGHRPIATCPSFAACYIANGHKLPSGYEDDGWGPRKAAYGEVGKKGWQLGAVGGAWAFTRRGYDAVGGFLDRCILGHADWFMAFGFVGKNGNKGRAIDIETYSSTYQEYIRSWQRRASEAIAGNIGYVDSYAIHHFHGPKGKRSYGHRDKVLVENKYNPLHDVMPDWQGVIQLAPGKPKLRDAIRSYFLSRSEDYHHDTEE